MRTIGTLNDGRKAFVFSSFLNRKNVLHHIDTHINKDWNDPHFGDCTCDIWIEDEDQVDEALIWFKTFVANPKDPIFTAVENSEMKKNEAPSPTPFQQNTTPHKKQKGAAPLGFITQSILAFCVFIFFLTEFATSSRQKDSEGINTALFTSQVERLFLFDYPLLYQRIEKFITLYGAHELQHGSDLPPEGIRLLKKIENTPTWPGIYQLLLNNGFQGVLKGFEELPTFEKIKEGQLWRFFSPCFLHGDLFHIFFNMLWLLVLGRQLEERLVPSRYILLMMIIAIISNTAQYLMSGPNFIGFSGILCGMLTFVWVRQKKAAWEGYQIDKMTLGFMFVFIVGISLLQLASFVVEKSFHVAFSPNIANMAHLTGAFVGYFLGKMQFFNWRHT